MKTMRRMKNKTLCFFLLCVTVSCFHSGGPIDGPTAASYEQGIESFLKGQDKKAETAFNNFLRVQPSHIYAGDAHYHLGRIYRNRGDFSEAREAFKEASNRARREEIQVLAQRFLGKTYLEDPNPLGVLKRAKRALEIFEELKEEHSHLISMPETLYQIGKCFLQLSEIDEAHKVFEKLLRQHSNNIWSDEVRKRKLTKYQNYFVQMGAFKDYKGCKNLIEKLKPQGFKPYMFKDEHLFTVRVGPFKSYLLARVESSKLKKLNYSAILKP
jgi:tetratricopeptide (TPR) repeat protein